MSIRCLAFYAETDCPLWSADFDVRGVINAEQTMMFSFFTGTKQNKIKIVRSKHVYVNIQLEILWWFAQQ